MNKFHRTMETPNNKKFSRIAIFGAITMLQGALYLVLAIWALLIIECQFDMTSTNLGTIIYFIYLRNSACGEVVWTKTQPTVAELPSMTFVAERTLGIVIAYIAISFLWILTSLFVIFGATRTKLSSAAFHCYFTPWAIVIMAGCILDVIATAFHIYDICNTATAESTFRFLEVQNIWEIIQTIEIYYKDFSYPSIIFTCVSSRLIVLFLVNVFGMLWAVKQATKLVSQKDDRLVPSSVDRNTPQSMDLGKPMTNDPNQYYYVPTRVLPETFIQPSHPYRRTFEPLKAGGAVPQDPQDLYEVVGNKKGKRVKLPRNTSNPDAINQADVVVVQRHREPSNAYQPPENRHSGNVQFRPQMEVPPTQYERNSGQDRSSYAVSGELRSQLPWSYFNAPENISNQRRALANIEDHEVLPPVPVPDYTLHFPKKERYTIQDRAAQLQMAAPRSSNDQGRVTQR